MTHYKKPVPAPELRQRVYACIDKLSDRATLSQAAGELEFIARALPSDSLSSFLSYILSVDASSKSPVRVHCLNLLSLLSQTHHDYLSPHVPKTIIPALLRRLRDPDSAVRAAVVAAAAALSPLGFSSLLAPLLGAVVTSDGNAQIGSCLSLKAAVDSAAVVGGADEAELRRALPKLLKLVRGEGFKAKAALLGLIGSVVAVNDGGVVNGRGGMVGNVVGCAVEMLCSEDWAARKAAAEVLEAVALAAERESAREVKRFVVSSLESRRFDKVKITRETMNRALDVWKDVAGGPEEDFLLSKSNSSISKDNGSHGGSPLLSRRYSFAGVETPKPKKTITKTRSSLSDGPVASVSSSNSASTHDIIGFETPQRKKTLSKSRSSLSDDDSTITDSSSISKSSQDGGFETPPQSKKPTSKNRSSLPEDFAATVTKKKSASKGNDGKTDMTSEEIVQKVRGFRPGSHVVPFVEEEVSRGLIVEGRGGQENEEVGENDADVEDLSLIRSQLLQIERQQSVLLDLLQRYMGNSQNGIDSLETRVTGLEIVLDEISYDLAVQSGRIPNNESAGSTCCPSTEFLSPKFWRRTEARSSVSKSSSCTGNVPNKDGNIEGALQVDDNTWGSVKSIGQNSQRGRTCSPRSFDGASTAPFIASVIRGT